MYDSNPNDIHLLTKQTDANACTAIPFLTCKAQRCRAEIVAVALDSLMQESDRFQAFRRVTESMQLRIVIAVG